LVVIAIIGMLIALLLPAIQQAREAARRMQCQNNLKQLGIGIHNYHSAYGQLPACNGIAFCKDPNSATALAFAGRYSGLIALLPFIEQQGLYDAWINSTLVNGGTYAYHPSAWVLDTAPADDPRRVQVSAFRCPSNTGTGQNTPPQGLTNYRFNLGDSPFHSTTSANNDTIKNIVWVRGLFGHQVQYDFSAVTDGTSNTALFAERAVGSAIGTVRTGVLKITEGVVNNANSANMWSGNNENAYLKSRTQCVNIRGTNGNYKTGVGATYPADYWGECGMKYSDGIWNSSGFHTVISPNGPACMSRSSREIGVLTPTSNHTGGVNLTRADGSVSFINENIDVGKGDTAAQTADTASPFGVWGALGTRSGGESETP
jgi:type II secretory pathway pseudopilin PulG